MKKNMVILLMLSVVLYGGTGILLATETEESKRYHFIEERSRLLQTGGFAGVYETYTITGSVVLAIDHSARKASFEAVDAVLDRPTNMGTDQLEEIFHLTELEGKIADNGELRFTGKNNDNHPIKVQVAFLDDLIVLKGNIISGCCDFFNFHLDAVAARGDNGWSFHYQDNYETDKAQTDSYDHSVFWPPNAAPPDEPYLVYNSPLLKPDASLDGSIAPFDAGIPYQHGQETWPDIIPHRTLMFVGYQGNPAHLSYRFPINPDKPSRTMRGVIELYIHQPDELLFTDLAWFPGYMLYSISSDGESWSPPEPLEPGCNMIPVSSVHGEIYLTLLGSRMSINHLAVHLFSRNATLHVPEDYPTIQAAIDAAVDGDIVAVAPGTYNDPGNRDIELRGKAIVVRSTHGPDETIINCIDSTDDLNSDKHRGFYIHENESPQTVIQGFTIIDGYAPGKEIPGDNMRWNLSPKHPIGGGIYIEYASPTIINCRVLRSRAYVGSGIGIVGGNPKIRDCRIALCGYNINNADSAEGGKGSGIGIIRFAEAEILDTAVVDNKPSNNGQGGGIYVRKASARIARCEILRNAFDGISMSGGGVYAGTGAEVVLRNCIIAYNYAWQGGGIFAVHGNATPGGLGIIDDLGVSGTNSGNGDGSVNNDDTGNGDGTGEAGTRNFVRVINCTVVANENGSIGSVYPIVGGIYARDCDILIKNSIVWFNDNDQIWLVRPASKSPVIYSNVQKGYEGQGNIDADPLFTPDFEFDFHLQSLFGRYIDGQWVIDTEHSPCIDTGDPSDPVGAEPEPNGKRINMGAYGGTMQASKGKGCLVYHVDTVFGNDNNTGLNRRNAFKTIQHGIDMAKQCDTVLVWPGIYREAIIFKGRPVTVQSAADAAVITPPEGDGIGVTFQRGEGEATVFKNFVISGCRERAVFCNFSSPTLANLTVVNNAFGIEARNNSQPWIVNSIFWNNTDGDLYKATAHYSCIQKPNSDGHGNISEYPWFANPHQGDYHLRSQRGRFVPVPPLSIDLGVINAPLGHWVLDQITSPCIDAGDPTMIPRTEHMPNGARVNMGAYGNTGHASLSEWPLRHDANTDGKVNFEDFASFVSEWLRTVEWAQ